jgi:8-oxo-dGTP pyrophosphatase MutT (NUDIX family)
MRQGWVRAIALGVFRQGDRILVAEYHDPSRDLTFYRPLGGTIEFGEHSRQTVTREIREEIGAEAVDLRYLGAIENLFVHNGQQGHEIVLLYEGRLADPSVYQQQEIIGCDDCEALQGQETSGTHPLKAVWKQLDSFGASAPLYPDGLLELLSH